MKQIFLPLALIALSACVTAPDLDVAAAPEGAYVLDPAHASVNWSLSHSGLSFYTARFDDISGALDFDPDAPTASRLDIRIDPKSRANILTAMHTLRFGLSQQVQLN